MTERHEIRRFSHIASRPQVMKLDPAGYMMSNDLAHAVEMALLLNMPLLVAGEPGVGKTQLGYAVALGLVTEEQPEVPVRKFETKSTSVSKDLFYSFDFMGRYNAAQTDGADPDPKAYIEYNALGLAILEAFPRDRIGKFLSEKSTHAGPRRSIVIIDEIDKAPRDFPNDLLNEFERSAFRVPELGGIGTPGIDGSDTGVDANLKPLVVITSNSERALPDAFLRRCIFYRIPFPTAEELRKIVLQRLDGLKGDCALLEEAIGLFFALRNGEGGMIMRKPPGTAEFLNWLSVLRARGLRPEDRLADEEKVWVIRQTFPALAKLTDDISIASSILDYWLSQDQ